MTPRSTFPHNPARRRQGFTLIELMIAVAVVSILVAIALPSYSRYVIRSRTPAMLDGLSSFAARMEQRYQDVGNYGSGSCGITPTSDPTYTLTCALSATTPAGYTATVVGTGTLATMSFSIDDLGTRKTLANPFGVPSTFCWSIRGGSCDS